MSCISPPRNGGSWRGWRVGIRHRIVTLSAPESFSWPPRGFRMTGSLPASIRHGRSSASGGSGSLWPASRVWRGSLEAGVRPAFPPSLVVPVKALDCELPHKLGLPLSRLSIQEIRQHVISQGLVAEIRGAALWRWLSGDALRLGQHRSWIFLAIRTSLTRPAPSLIFTRRLGKIGCR